MASLRIEPQTDRVIVKGDTYQVRTLLKRLGGKYSSGSGGWVFRDKSTERLEQDLGSSQDVTSIDVDGEVRNPKARRWAPKPKLAELNEQLSQLEHGDSETGDMFVGIGDTCRITVSRYRGNLGVDIRRFYRDEDTGALKATPMGIRLQPSEWTVLCDTIENAGDVKVVDGSKVLIDVARGIKIEFTSQRVDVRKYFTDFRGEVRPTRTGANLKHTEWARLKEAIPQLNSALDRRRKRAKRPRKAKSTGGSEDEAATSSGKRARSISAAAAPDVDPAADSDKAAFAELEPEAAAPAISRKKIRRKLVKLLEGRDLETTSIGALRCELEAKLSLPPGALDERRDEVREEAAAILESLSARNE